MKLPLIFFLLLISYTTVAQTAQKNLDKYWQYRQRFLGLDGGVGFIDLGENSGQSLPMAGRNSAVDCQQNWHLKDSDCNRRAGKGMVEWGDATVFHGYYIATLALEYRNLLDAKQSVTKTKQELYLALKTYERLDRAAEIALGLAPKLDGFFIRDDVAADFYKKAKGNTAGEMRFKKANQTYNCLKSAYGCGTPTLEKGYFISQDQALALLMGFAFVKELLPKETYGNTREKFSDLASYYTHVMVSYMRNNKWRVRGPNGEKVPNEWGGDLRAFNYLIAKAADRITEKKYLKTYQKGSSKNIGRILSSSFGWAFNMQAERNHHMIFEAIIMTGNWSPRKIAKRCLKSDKIVYALAYSVFNKKALDKRIKKTDLEAMINTAPWSGPCFGTADCKAPNGWKSSDRWWHSNHKDGNPYGIHMEWTGIDFMFLYNLYHYLYKADLPRFKNGI
ncbi:MAG: hypothetical protein AB8G15_04210 [Saprospiraceae bacterium]